LFSRIFRRVISTDLEAALYSDLHNDTTLTMYNKAFYQEFCQILFNRTSYLTRELSWVFTINFRSGLFQDTVKASEHQWAPLVLACSWKQVLSIFIMLIISQL